MNWLMKSHCILFIRIETTNKQTVIEIVDNQNSINSISLQKSLEIKIDFYITTGIKQIEHMFNTYNAAINK